jgi:hypothetical protein
MARIDDFIQAKAISARELSVIEPDLIAECSGGKISRNSNGKPSLLLNFLNKETIISWPEMEFSYKNSDNEISIQQQVLVLHYLIGVYKNIGVTVSGEWVSFQDIPDGRFYMDAFIKRAKEPLLRVFGNIPGLMPKLAQQLYDASPIEFGDHSVTLLAFPKVPVSLILYEGDDEFLPEANILFDRSISIILSAEDTAWLAGMVVYPLIGMAAER